MTNNYYVTNMSIDHLPGVMAIENTSFSLPWDVETYKKEIVSNQFAHYYVLIFDDKVVAYCGSWIVFEECSITTIAVHKDYRGFKFGKVLLKFVLERAKLFGAQVATLEVRISNVVAQNMYKSLGFKNGGIRKSYYTDNYEDAQMMWVNLYE
ncbi:MAG: Ribosomal-protein-S18p-alanine acetyltransferase [Bacillales bacterium]|jgi:ribosomal-protein-alanine N-acetyltransferase|nr:Ribosomal-protein-S18p-alanine acetyltransferase [Bacillales bacterium]